MRITLTPEQYATAFGLLARTARHHENIGRFVEERVLPHLPARPSLLDVGAGPGTVAQRLAPHFGSLTLLEPNREQIRALKLPGATIVHSTLEEHSSSEPYDLVVCSHVLYHVPFADWGGFIDRLLAFTRPGGFCLVLLSATRGQNYDLHRDFSEPEAVSPRLLQVLREKRIPHEVAPAVNAFSASTFEEMNTLCRFFVYEDCYTAEQLAAMTGEELRALDDKIRVHTERCLASDGVYRLEQEDELILIPKP